MAWTVTKYNTVFGNKKTVGMKLVADAATQNVETGLSFIEWYSFAKGSMTTVVGLTISPNSMAAGTSLAGTIGFSGFTSGDEMYITVYGR